VLKFKRKFRRQRVKETCRWRHDKPVFLLFFFSFPPHEYLASSKEQQRFSRRLMEPVSGSIITRRSVNKFLTRQEISDSVPRLFVQICWVTIGGWRKLSTWPIALRTWVVCFDNYQIKQPLQKISHKLKLVLSSCASDINSKTLRDNIRCKFFIKPNQIFKQTLS
jgi:hypothetical protein